MLELTTTGDGTAATVTGDLPPQDLRRLIDAKPAHLFLNAGGVDDLSFLPQLPLRTLDLVRVAPGTPITPVNFLTGLVQLNLGVSYSGELKANGLVSLEVCGIEWGAGAESIAECPRLRHVKVSGYKGVDLALFTALPNLAVLEVSNARRLSRLDDLASTNLRGLGLYYCTQLTTLAGVPVNGPLVSLDAQTCTKVTDWHLLAEAPVLRYVALQNVGSVPSILPFQQLAAQLEFFWFPENTNIIDGRVHWLADVPTLRATGFKNRRHYDATNDEVEAAIVLRHGAATWYPPTLDALS